VIPGEPRANTAPKVRDPGAILKNKSVDMLQEANLLSSLQAGTPHATHAYIQSLEARLAVLQHNLQVFQAKACMLVGLLLCATLLAPLPTA